MASTAFRVSYADVEPQDVTWLMAPTAAKAQFRQLVVQLVLAEKDADLAAGKDRFGFQMARLSRFTIAHRRSAMGPADPTAPPLTPAQDLSRTRANLDGRAMPTYAEFFWRGGWGQILNYHRIGAVNHWAKSGRLPVRDVIGISPAATNRVRQAVAAWWSDWKTLQAAQKIAAAFTPPQAPRTRPGRSRPVPTPQAPPLAASPVRPGPGRSPSIRAAASATAASRGGSLLTRIARRIAQAVSSTVSRLLGQ